VVRTINISFKGKESVFSISKLSRSKLYGRKRRIPIDADGNSCTRASLDVVGGILLKKGMTGQGYLDDKGNWLERSTLTGVDGKGEVLKPAHSTLGEVVQGEEASLEEALDLRVSSVYALEPKELDDDLKKSLEAGSLVGLDFNYREDYQMERAFLAGNKEGYFAMVGQPATPGWSEYEKSHDVADEESYEDDELDFEMF
jgi:hypothetical protein